jgi:hypothetical protein
MERTIRSRLTEWLGAAHGRVAPMPVIREQVVRITDFVPASAILDGFNFRDCTILGPAVLLPLDATSFENCVFEGDPDAIAWEISPTRARVIGAVAVRQCKFSGCRISGIGIAGPPDQIQQFRNSLPVTDVPQPVG